MKLLDGKAVATAIKEDLKAKVEELKAQGHKAPHLAAIIVGEDPASQTYVGSKIKTCGYLGYDSTNITMPADVSEEELLAKVEEINQDPNIDGLIVQSPLPAHLTMEKVINHIKPEKDVDGFHPVNIGKMVRGWPALLPATPYGVMKILEHYDVETSGKLCVVLGRSLIVGRPMSILLSSPGPYGNATVIVAHSRTQGLKELCQQADIIVAAIGRPHFVTADMVKEGAVVVDVGIHRLPDESKKRGYRITGDVDFEEVAPKTSWITPVPGGVGAMTIAGLMLNTFNAATGKV